MAELGRFDSSQLGPWLTLLAIAFGAMWVVWRHLINPFLSSTSSWFVRLGLLSFSSFGFIWILVLLYLLGWLCGWQPFPWILGLLLFDGAVAMGLGLALAIVRREPPT